MAKSAKATTTTATVHDGSDCTVWYKNRHSGNGAPLPSDAVLRVVHAVQPGNPGCERAFIACLLMPGGVTVAAYSEAFKCGPARNNLGKLIKARLLDRDMIASAGRAQVLKVYLTAAAVKLCDAARVKVPAHCVRQPAKAAKASKPRKPRAAKVTAAPVAPVDAAPADAPQA